MSDTSAVDGGLDYPFLQPAFLRALEDTGAVSPATGWQPLFDLNNSLDNKPLLPLYLKHHSQGEYVFDHGWAQGYARAGLEYYPKLISAIPYTPVPGPRWRGFASDPAEAIFEQVLARVEEQGASGWHLLFADQPSIDALASLPLIERQACHFRWFNRGYTDFDDFLAALMSRKRKNLRRERARVADQGVRVSRACGTAISPLWWQHFYRCYALTYLRRGQRPYLSAAFFEQLAANMPEHLLMVVAEQDGELLAAALYLFDSERLYGRYWGTLRDLDGLHFELCYYQGIEFAIAQGLREFDPGVQGEHKLLRGFEPVITRSLHWLSDNRFRQAVADFCAQEARAVANYRDEALGFLPYRRGS